MSKASEGCDTCNKSSLSLLLLRPSVVAKDKTLAPPGAEAVQDADSHVKGLTPARAPTESRYVLRLLRAGYVYLYIAKPPKGVKQWRVFRVTDQADLVPQDNAWFNQPDATIACPKPGHNTLGLKIVDIPMAHKITEVWVAYSANLWNGAIRAKNGGNPKAMHKVPLAACMANTFTPTAENLKAKVLECALSYQMINGSTEHDLPFNTLVGQVDSMAKQLERIAAIHPKTKGKELAVVLSDPVGLATDLNGLRLRRHEQARQEIEKPENAHPLNSSNTLLGMKHSIMDANMAESFQNVAPLKTKEAYEQSKGLPAGTEWWKLNDQERKALIDAASDDNPIYSVLKAPYRRAFANMDLGRVVYPDHTARAAAWAKAETEKTWKKELADKYDEGARKSWVDNFEKRLKTAHYDPLAKYEDDWIAAVLDGTTLTYFQLHFDENDRNDPKEQCSPGLIYARESQYIHTPGPFTTGPVLDQYVAMMEKPLKDVSAVAVRSIVANQKTLFESMEAFLAEFVEEITTSPGIGEGKRDKAYDFMKGLLLGAHEAEKPNAVQALLKKYSWLGDALAMYAVGHLTAFSGAVVSLAARSDKAVPTVVAMLGRMQGLWAVHRTLEMALEGAMSGKAPKVPVVVKARVDVDLAMEAWRARKGQQLGVSHRQLKRQRGGGKIAVTVLTDSDAIKAAKGDLETMLKDPASGQVSMKKSATATVAASGGSAIILTEEEVLRICSRQMAPAGKMARDAVRKLFQSGVSDIRAVALSLEGRLAIGSIVVQSLGIYYGLRSLNDAKTEKEVRDAWYGLYDSGAGALGGALEVFAVAVNARALGKGGEAVAAKNLPLAGLRFSANIAGAVGGVVNAIAAWAKYNDAKARGDREVARLYWYSGVAFAGTAATSSVLAASTIAETLLARGVTNAALEATLTRVAGAGAAEVLGLSVSGWGLLLLGAGVVYQVWAVASTPTPIQKWVGRSYFGKGDDKFPKGDWKAEFEGLQKALQESRPKPEDMQATVSASANAPAGATP